MSLYDQIAAIPGGPKALACGRLRREALKVVHAARGDQAVKLPRRMRRGNGGSIRINELAGVLHDLGYEVELTLVEAGQPRAQALADMDATHRRLMASLEDPA